MKIKTCILLSLSFLLFLSCAALHDTFSSLPEGRQRDGYRVLTSEEAYRWYELGEKIIFVDVGLRHEYALERIEGSIWVDLEEVESEAAEKLPDKEETIFLYCRLGRRNHEAAVSLTEQGYQNVFAIGRMRDWPGGTQRGTPPE